MFARLFSSSKRTVDTTTVTATGAKATETNGNVRFPSPSAVTEPGSVANSHTNTLPDSPPRVALLRTPSPSHRTVEADADALKELFKSCPPKIVYSYLTSQIMNASPGELHSLASFFSELQPPTRLHCVRCHKSYFEVDNDDRSCTMPHDDESAEVEHVKGGGFETRWDCCGRTVEGSGELGPPSGWCYEGRHTIDLKRARYRNDSSLANDKLVSCARKKCFAQQPKEEKRPPPSRAGKPRSVYIPDDARSVRSTRSTRSLKEGTVATLAKPVSTIGLSAADKTSPTSTAGKKRKRITKKEVGSNEEEEEEEEEQQQQPAVKPKSKATRARPRTRDKEKDQTDMDDDVKSVKSVRSVKDTPAAKRRRRKSVAE